MSLITKELVLHEDVCLRISIKNYYIIADVFLVIQRIVNDKLIESKFRINEPFDEFIPLIEKCKKRGFEVHRN